MFGDWLDFVTCIREHQEDLLELLTEHVQLTALSVLLGILIALPLAVLVSRADVLAKPMT